MKSEALKKTIDDFLNLIDEGAESLQQTESLLRIYLDRIALASSEMEVPFDDSDYLGGSSENEEDLRKLICSRFPNYGFYNIPGFISKEIANTDIDVGDGIDDIRAAQENGVMSVGALYGYGGKEPEQADFSIKVFHDLLDIFSNKHTAGI